MKITITRSNLLTGVMAIQRAISTRSTSPILLCIKIDTRNGFVYFTATDLDISIECYVPAEVLVEGTAIVPARHFTEIVRRLPDAAVTMELLEEGLLSISYEESQLSIKTLPSADFPKIPEVTEGNKFELNTQVFKQMIKQTVFAASADEIRPLFTGILCEFEGDKFRLVATDTHRLAFRQINVDNKSEEVVKCIIPAKILGELARLMYEDDETCCIIITDNLASFKHLNIRVVCRLLEGEFPNYRQVVPLEYNIKMKVNKKKLSEAVERISLFTQANDKSNTIGVKIQGDTVVVSSQSEMGHGYELINTEKEGDDVNILFNSKYILDALRVLDEENVYFELTGAQSASIIRPDSATEFIYLLLPIRA